MKYSVITLSNSSQPANPVYFAWNKFLFWIEKTFGLGGVYFLGGVIIIIIIFIFWEEWRFHKFYSLLKKVMSKFPVAPAGKFSIVVGDLNEDENFKYKNLVIQKISELNGIHVIKINKPVWKIDGDIGKSIETAAKNARSILKKIKADVFLWGIVLTVDGASRLKLFWTTSRSLSLKKSFENYMPTVTLELPDLFINDLGTVLELLIQTTLIELTENRSSAEKLQFEIQKTEELLNKSSLIDDPKSRANTEFILAQSLVACWKCSNEIQHLEKAVCIFRDLISRTVCKEKLYNWSLTASKLGSALSELGEIKNDSNCLLEAETVMLELLDLEIPEIEPQEKASVYNVLGCNYLRLIDLLGADYNTRAQIAFKNALKLIEHEESHALWAIVKINSAALNFQIGEQTNDPEYYSASILMFNESLSVYSRKSNSLVWASITMNIGNSYRTLGDLQGNENNVNASIHSYNEALRVLKKNKHPKMWGSAQCGLAKSLLVLGVMKGDRSLMNEAEEAFDQALTVSNPDNNIDLWLSAIKGKADVIYKISEKDKGPGRLHEAVRLLNSALERLTMDLNPPEWAGFQVSLGNVLLPIGKKLESVEALKDAEKAYNNARLVYKPDYLPQQWRVACQNIGNVYIAIGTIENDPKWFLEAIDLLETTSRHFSGENDKFNLAILRLCMGSAYGELAIRTAQKVDFLKGIDVTKSSLEIFMNSGADYYVKIAEENINRLVTLAELEHKK